VFQCLLIDGENAGENALRDGERFVVSDEEFQTFIDRHSSVRTLVPESSSAMRYSYLILDEYVSSCRGIRSLLPVTFYKSRQWRNYMVFGVWNKTIRCGKTDEMASLI